MNISAFNPELVRNGRIHLRLGRAVVIVAICAVISISAAAFTLSEPSHSGLTTIDFRALLTLILTLQIVALLIGGGIYCLQSIHREKDLNTFDFQRITRLTPFELVIGKLFGAPIQMYFTFLCLIPVAVWAAARGNVPAGNLALIYALVILGSIAYHAFALLLSMVIERGTSAGAIIFLLIIVAMSTTDFSTRSSPIGLHTLSPFFVYGLISIDSGNNRGYDVPPSSRGPFDTFFGAHIAHVWVLPVLYLTLTAWFLLALVRNVKRDPLAYELYSPAQGLALTLYLNFLLLGSLRWSIPQFHYAYPSEPVVTYSPAQPAVAEGLFLSVGVMILALFGLTLLRNRDQVRRRIRELGNRAAGLRAAIWPAPYVLSGSMLAGAAIVSMIQLKLHPQADWTMQSGVLVAAFFAAWVARDVLYLQWMNLRRVRRPIMIAILYMIVFYACVGAIFVPLRLYNESGLPYASAFLPFSTLQATVPSWRSAWILALLILCLQSAAFAGLQWRALQDLLKKSAET